MILTVEVKPKSHERKVIAWKDAQTVVIALTSPPIDGKANRELILFLSKKLKVPKTSIEIKRGQGARVKHVSLPDGTDLQGLV